MGEGKGDLDLITSIEVLMASFHLLFASFLKCVFMLKLLNIMFLFCY